MKQIVRNFVTYTMGQAQRLAMQCDRLGVDVSGQFKAMLENKKD